MFYIEHRMFGWAIVTAEGKLWAGPFRERAYAEALAEKVGLPISE